jgi:hypothetical protein
MTVAASRKTQKTDRILTKWTTWGTKRRTWLEGLRGCTPTVVLTDLRDGQLMIPTQLEWKSMYEERLTYDVRRTSHSLSSGISHPSHTNSSRRRQSGTTEARRLDTRLSSISSPGRVHSALFGRTTSFLMCCGIPGCLVRPVSAALQSLFDLSSIVEYRIDAKADRNRLDCNNMSKLIQQQCITKHVRKD